MIKHWIKLLLKNIVVFFALIVIINISIIALQRIQQSFIKSDEIRDQLPNYKGIPWAKKHFEEFAELSSEYKSYIAWRRVKYSGQTIQINNNGIRITPQHKNTNSNSSLVVFLGGSTMWGTGANDANTIPALFSNYGKGNYKSLNYGESGYRAFQSYLFLREKINEGIRPKLVVSYDGVNEIAGFQKNISPNSHMKEAHIQEVVKGSEKNQLSFLNYLFEPTKKFIKKLKNNDDPEKKYNYVTTTKRTELVAKSLLDTWLDMKSISEKNKALFFCVLQPNAAFSTPNINHIEFISAKKRPYKLLYTKIIQLLKTPKYKELSENFIDLSRVLDGKNRYFIDMCHLSPNGNEVIAKKIYSDVSKRLYTISYNNF